MTDRDATSPSDREDSAAFRAGLATGRIMRSAIVVFGFAVGGLAIGGGLAPERWRTAIVVGSAVVGALGAFGAALRNPVWAAIGAYVLLIGAGSVLQSVKPRPTAALVAVAVGTIFAAIGFMAFTVRAGRQSRELERMLFSESTSIAFFVTMVGAITYALLEAWIDAPKVSMWLVWTLGMGTWAIGSLILGRRYS